MKFNYIYIFIAVFLICGLTACIDELNIDTEEKRNILVVEGIITSEYGPHKISLSKSAKYGSILDDDIKRELNATLWLRNEIGDQVFLTEGSSGNYYTPEDFKAKVGSEYTLSITLANGERYISSKEKVIPVPVIDSLIVVWEKQPSLSDIQFGSGMEVYSKWKDPEDEQNFYMWKTSGVYKINTRPDLHVGRDFFGNPFSDPKDCCSECYVYETLGGLSIFKDNLTNGNEITQKVAYLEDDGGRFMERYLVILEQRSLTKSAFRFFDLLNNQLSIQGNIFDPPPAQIGTNIINLDKPDEEVIGYFAASDVSRDSVFIDNEQILERQPTRVINDDCRVLSNSTTDIPPFWN